MESTFDIQHLVINISQFLRATPAHPIDGAMGQQLRRRAKRKRRKAYLERKRVKQKSLRREPARPKPKKSAPAPAAAE